MSIHFVHYLNFYFDLLRSIEKAEKKILKEKKEKDTESSANKAEV